MCHGSEPPSSNLVVTCIIRQPMDTVGVKKRTSSRSRLFSFGSQINFLQMSAGQATGSQTRQSNSVGPTQNRNYGLKSSGLDISKSSAYSLQRSASRPRRHSHENLSAGGKRQNSTVSKAKALATAGALGAIPNGYKHPHILTT